MHIGRRQTLQVGYTIVTIRYDEIQKHFHVKFLYLYRIGLAMDAWMWPLKDEPELAESIEQPILFINSANFQTRFSLEIMKRFTADADKRHVVTIK